MSLIKLSERALLVNLSISQWAGRKLDKQATSATTQNFNAQNGAGNFNKKLLPESKELKAIAKIAAELRIFLNDSSLPWLSDGTRILPSKNYLNFTTEFRKRKAEFDNAVNDFLKAYPQLQADAQKALGNLFNEADYPSEAKLRKAFSCEIQVLPLPDVNDFRTEVTDAEKQAFLDNMKAIQDKGRAEVYSRLSEVISKATERLSKPDAIFRDTLVDNINELLDLIPNLNLTDDASLESLRVKVKQAIGNSTAQSLRDNATERQDAAQKLAEIQKAMGAFMGAQ